MPTKKKKTILNCVFRCKACGQEFRAGTNGIGTLTERVKEHFTEKGHREIIPVNPPKGMYYEDIASGEMVGKPFSGKDKYDWIESVRSASAGMNTRPAWKLKLK